MNLRESTLKRIVQLMKDPKHGLVIKDRTFHFHVFPDCFVGNEFVTWTLHNGVMDTREHAAMLGQDLLDRGIIYHASNDQPFKDGHFFYTFQKFPEITDAELDVIVIRMKAHPTGVSIQDRSHHLRNYRDCFVGKEAVDWFVNNIPKYATSRPVGVKLGQELMNKGIVHSATQQPFTDTGDFYFFQKPVFAGYLGKLTKAGTEWKIRWFSIKDIKEKKLWYFNSPRDPVPRDFISLVDAYIRVVLDQDIAYMEVCTPMRIFTLRPTSSVLLARWVRVLSEFIGVEGCDNNLRMEHAERSISLHESRVSTKMMREKHLVTLGPSLGEVAGIGLLDGLDQLTLHEVHPNHQLPLPSQTPLLPLPLPLPLQPPPDNDFQSVHSGPDSRHDSERSGFGNETPLDTLRSPDMETLDLMYDDELDFDIEDELLFPSSIQGKSPETKFEEGMIGEANFVMVREEEREEEGGVTAEQKAALARIKDQLLSTSSQDNDFIPSAMTPLSIIPSMYSDEMELPKNRYHHNNDIHNFHML